MVLFHHDATTERWQTNLLWLALVDLGDVWFELVVFSGFGLIGPILPDKYESFGGHGDSHLSLEPT